MHFFHNYEGVWVLVIAFVSLTLYFLFKYVYERNLFSIQNTIKEAQAVHICDLLLMFSWLCIAGWIIYFLWFFKPYIASEMMQSWTSITAKNISEFTKMWML